MSRRLSRRPNRGFEYQLAGVNQVQVNLPAGLSFPVGLKYILRQDPDVIMIGEIRDLGTWSSVRFIRMMSPSRWIA